MPLKLSTKVRSPGKPGARMSKIFKAAFKDAQPKIVALIVDRVGAEATKVFKSMAPIYIDALNRPDSVKLTEDGIEVQLTTKTAQAMEGGADAFDIKKAMLAKTTKFSKSGVPYVDVPFTHTPSGTSGTTPLPVNIKRAIDARAESEGTSTTRLPARTSGKKFTRTLLTGGKRKKQKVRHKRGIHDDLVRRGKPSRRSSASYSTVRRISAKSSASSWMHPGFKGAGLLKKTLPKLKPEIRAILSDSIAKVTGGKR